MWELHPNGTSSEKGPLSHRNNAGSFKNNRYSNKDANDNIFVSETIDTIVNSLYHIIEKTSSSCLPPSRWRTREVTERKELICVTSQAVTRANQTVRNKFIFTAGLQQLYVCATCRFKIELAKAIIQSKKVKFSWGIYNRNFYTIVVYKV